MRKRLPYLVIDIVREISHKRCKGRVVRNVFPIGVVFQRRPRSRRQHFPVNHNRLYFLIAVLDLEDKARPVINYEQLNRSSLLLGIDSKS